jgi:hypothetical protein
MFLTVAATIGFLLWIVLWSIGVKALDAFLLTALIIVVATTIKMTFPSLPGNRASSVDE